MTSILDAVRQQLGPDTIRQLSGAIGADPATTSNAVNLAIPTLLGGLSQNAAQPQGAAALDNALSQHDGSILDTSAASWAAAVRAASAARSSATFSATGAARWNRASAAPRASTPPRSRSSWRCSRRSSWASSGA